MKQGFVGGPDSRAVAAKLVVSSEHASLYARQDDEGQTLEHLARGETLTPLVQSVGNRADWYMVRTARGTVGWIKSGDVREEGQKKP
ncbi:MAG TPA: hypothetical protein VNN77_10675 [candidate division Zixibacteria bacterium]|nr:hypothetical protein [candidate division Zixibacteria bacterium]